MEKEILDTRANISTAKEAEEIEVEEDEEFLAVPIREALSYVNKLKQLGHNLITA